MGKLADHLRSRLNKMAHATGQAVTDRLKQRWTAAMELMIDGGAGYEDLVQYLDARSADKNRLDQKWQKFNGSDGTR